MGTIPCASLNSRTARVVRPPEALKLCPKPTPIRLENGYSLTLLRKTPTLSNVTRFVEESKMYRRILSTDKTTPNGMTAEAEMSVCASSHPLDSVARTARSVEIRLKIGLNAIPRIKSEAARTKHSIRSTIGFSSTTNRLDPCSKIFIRSQILQPNTTSSQDHE